MRGALRQRRRDRLGERVEAVDGAGRRARADGVDDDHRVGARPLLDQPDRLALVRAHARGDLVAQAAGDGQAGPVVAAPRVAEADDERVAQARSTSSVEEVRRAGDAGVVVADRLLAEVPQRGRPRARGCRPGSRAGRPRSTPGSARSAGRSSPRGSCRPRRAGSGARTARAAPRSSRSRCPRAAPPRRRARRAPRRPRSGAAPRRARRGSRRCARRCCGTGCGRRRPSPASAAASRASGESCPS